MRLGIFGGSFDPIHFGHLRLAEEARERFGLQQVVFIPAYVSPFKTDRPVTPAEHRLAMARLATADNAVFQVSGVECERSETGPGPSYTVDTLRLFARENPSAELWFITGTDAAAGLPRWREPEAVLALARFAVAVRPGTTEADARASLAHLPESWLTRIAYFTMTELDISSTDLRARFARQRSVRYLLPRSVEEYIEAHRVYTAVPGEK